MGKPSLKLDYISLDFCISDSMNSLFINLAHKLKVNILILGRGHLSAKQMKKIFGIRVYKCQGYKINSRCVIRPSN